MIEGKLLPMLYVASVPRAVAFYRDLLGFEFAGWWDEATATYLAEPPPGGGQEFAELTAGDLVLHLHQAAAGEPSASAPASILHLQVADADAYHREVTARGGTFEPPRDQLWGWRQFYVRDPDGHQWSFHHRL